MRFRTGILKQRHPYITSRTNVGSRSTALLVACCLLLLVASCSDDDSPVQPDPISYASFGQPEILVDTSGDTIDVGLYAVPALADIDADGDLDLFIGEWWGQIWFYRNVGSADSAAWHKVTERYMQIDVGRSAAPAFVDIDGDDDLDLLIGSNYSVGFGSGRLGWYRNVGSITVDSFEVVTPSALNLTCTGIGKPFFVDADGDSDSDMYFGYKDDFPESHHGLVYYRNDGDENAPRWTLLTTEFAGLGEISDAGSIYHNPCMLHLDSDTLLDLLVASHTAIKTYTRQVAASGSSWEECSIDGLTGLYLGRTPVLTTGDLNGDGIADLLLGRGAANDPDPYSDNTSGTLYFIPGLH